MHRALDSGSGSLNASSLAVRLAISQYVRLQGAIKREKAVTTEREAESISDTTETIDTNDTDARKRGFLGWCVEGARSAGFMAPRWEGLQATPVVIAAIMASILALLVLVERLYIVGPADFYWQAIASGWAGTAVLAWACYLLRPTPSDRSTRGAAPSAAHLFAMVLAQTLAMTAACGLVFAVLIRGGLYTEQTLGQSGLWALWVGPTLWVILGQLVLLLRSWRGSLQSIAIATLAVVTVAALNYAVQPADFWYARETANNSGQPRRLRLTQEVMEAQQPVLAQRLNDLKPQRPGLIDLYAVTFAPFATEDVFRKESALVAEVMSQRFDAGGRTLQLLNHVDTLAQSPWATPLNLRRTIQRIASVMDKDEDIFFIHLTSHGARDGELAAYFRPMEVETLKPADLRKWLDEAGIRHRVISISACFSGSWIPSLADQNTLVMTASDADHTSYGCGRKSELTFFGRAMYDEQLRSATLSFEEAHGAARAVIKQREEEAGKDDGYSNPQISVGAGIRNQLARLRERLQASGRH